MTEPNETPPPAPPRAGGMVSTIVARAVLPAMLVAFGVVCAGIMIAVRPSAKQAPAEASATRVEVVKVVAADTTARVEATGVVEPAQQVAVMPQVTGSLTWLAPEAIPGGRLEAGEVYAKIDTRDYGLALDQAKSTVRSAELELELERGRADIAAKEWALLKSDRDPSSAPLALRGPQLEVAQHAVDAASASLKRAQIDLSRTRLKAPFNAMVAAESLELGQVVAPGGAVATLIGTDEFWVTVSIPVDELGAVQLPSEAHAGSTALVRQDLGGGRSVVRTGEVRKLMAQLDPQTRTAQLIVSIPDPLVAAEGELPLLPGA